MRLQTEFDFDAAHRLVSYKGKCSNLHGHIWKVVIELNTTGEDPQLDDVGILWDFTNAKKIKDILDHKTLLKECPENELLVDAIVQTCGIESILLCEENPTAEYLCKFIATEISKHLKYECVVNVSVYESAKSFAEETVWRKK